MQAVKRTYTGQDHDFGVVAVPARPPGSSDEAMPGLRLIRSVEELDEMMDRLDQAARLSDDELRRLFPTFAMQLELELPDDPYSEAYRERVFELFQLVRGEAYDPSNERTTFDLEASVAAPFPYGTQSADTVGNQLMAIGHLIKTMALPPGSQLLELGCGWGNVSLALAQMGHHVTAIDIDPSMVELVRERARRLGVSVEVHIGDFASASELGRQFDAVLFVASFHHAHDHLALLRSIDRVVSDEGKLVFAAEPISDALPAPWCLRLDGESLWQIRRRGWLELGFQERYFLETLELFGWKAERSVCDDTPFGVVFVARRR
jgi:2-polyprenyl-3-methyl-5-hydroxy-6-metoxy-1,4-benzoquinol methylase